MISNRIVSDAAIEDALNQLAQLDDKEAELKAARDFGETKAKEIFSRKYLDAVGTIAEREAQARISDEYIEHMDNLRGVILNHQTLKNRRERLILLKDVWQSEQANMRQRT